MRISLIYVQTIEGNNVIPPIGLMYVAAVARKAGYDVQFMDMDPEAIDIVAKVRKFSPALVGISFLTTEFEKARDLSHKLRETLPGVIICSGGVHTTIDPETVLKRFNLDFCVIGEGENTLLEVCKRIETGRSYNDVKGICFYEGGRFIRNPGRELIEDLDSLPFPARDLVDFSNIYLTFPGVIRGKYVRSTVVMAGRGCYFNCAFCAVEKMFGRRYRLRSPKNILDEIIHLKKDYGVKGIFFVDSTLTANREWMISFCEEVLRRNIKFTWSGNTRVDTVDSDMLRLMRKAGCEQLDYGIESGSPKILDILNKRITPEKSIAAVRMTKQAGIRVGGSFILGNPGENIEDVEMTFELAKKLKADYTVFFYSVPYPGTNLWEIARERNLIAQDIIYDNQWNIRSSETPLMIEYISKEKLQFYRAKLQNYFFLRNYFRLNNIIIGLRLLFIMIKYPLITWKAVKRTFKSRRYDSLVEEILVAYRKSVYKYY